MHDDIPESILRDLTRVQNVCTYLDMEPKRLMYILDLWVSIWKEAINIELSKTREE